MRPDRTCRIRITGQNVPRSPIFGFSAAILYPTAILFFRKSAKSAYQLTCCVRTHVCVKFRPDWTCRIRITSQNVPRLPIFDFSAAILYPAAILFFSKIDKIGISAYVLCQDACLCEVSSRSDLTYPNYKPKCPKIGNFRRPFCIRRPSCFFRKSAYQLTCCVRTHVCVKFPNFRLFVGHFVSGGHLVFRKSAYHLTCCVLMHVCANFCPDRTYGIQTTSQNIILMWVAPPPAPR